MNILSTIVSDTELGKYSHVMERLIASNVSLNKINCKEWMNMLDTSALLDT